MKKAIEAIFIILFTILATGPKVHSGPVRNINAVYSQPDGTSFNAKIRGDEWIRIRTTEDGCAIIRDEDGWWCYGTYEREGRLSATGYHVGQKTPESILSDSRNIPYCILREHAEAKRAHTSAKRSASLKYARQSCSMTKSTTVSQKRRGLVILAQFQDVKMTFTKADFLRMLNEQGYNGTGSAKDYYEQQFGEGWEFNFDVSDPVTLPNNLRYYGENDADGNDIRPVLMAWTACKEADSTIDFSIYDEDGDGEVENVYIFYAGHDESENTDQTELIWAHQYYIASGMERIPDYRMLDGVRIDRYACSSELTGRRKLSNIGVFCHEYAHTFGLPDFYDTNYDDDNAWAAGLWSSTSLMDGGSHNNDSATPPNLNCIERKLLGLSQPVEIKAGNSYTLDPIHLAGQSYIINTETPGEYFLLEYRSNDGWDKYIGGKGMLVYHIDENGREGRYSKWELNTVNTDPYHQCADLIEADKRRDIIESYQAFSNLRGIFYPQNSATSITPDEHPAYKLWNSNSPEISIVGISISDNKVHFRATSSKNVPLEIPEVSDFSFSAYPDAFFVTFKATDPAFNGKAVMEWNKKDSSSSSDTIVLEKGTSGQYSYLITGLEGGNTLYDIQVKFELEGAFGEIHQTQLMTKRSPAVKWPYLYLSDRGNIVRSEGFPAHVVNTSDAMEKSWYLDGEPLELHDGCLIYPQNSGTLSCQILWKDGSTNIVAKEITLKDQR